MMLGLLLARAGVEVTVLEKARGFPTGFPRRHRYVAMMPQWDFLNFLAAEAAREPTFSLLMEHEATSLIFDGGRVTGVRYRTRGGPEGHGTEGVLHADLVVATDGRHSVLRRAAGLQPKDYPVPFDTWWFKLPRHASEKGAVAGIVPAFRDREAMIALFRDDYYQMGYLAPKGMGARIRSEGVERFRERVAALRPDLADRMDSIRSLDDLHWLDVRLDRLRRWYVDGLLCIGDAAHAMSPVLFFVRHVPMVRWLLPRLIAFGPRPEHAPGFARRVQPREAS